MARKSGSKCRCGAPRRNEWGEPTYFSYGAVCECAYCGHRAPTPGAWAKSARRRLVRIPMAVKQRVMWFWVASTLLVLILHTFGVVLATTILVPQYAGERREV